MSEVPETGKMTETGGGVGSVAPTMRPGNIGGYSDNVASFLSDVAKGFLAKKGIISPTGGGGGTYSSSTSSTAVSVNPVISVIGGSGDPYNTTSGTAVSSPSTTQGTYGTGRAAPISEVPSGFGVASTPALSQDDFLMWALLAGAAVFLFAGGGKGKK